VLVIFRLLEGVERRLPRLLSELYLLSETRVWIICTKRGNKEFNHPNQGEMDKTNCTNSIRHDGGSFLDQTLTVLDILLNANLTGMGVKLDRSWSLMSDFLVFLLLVGFSLLLWGMLRLCDWLMEE
jgi:hypothetical protein